MRAIAAGDRSILLADADEDFLTRLCWVMAQFEPFYRTPRAVKYAAEMLSDPDTYRSPRTMLDWVPEWAVTDTRKQVLRAQVALAGLRQATPSSKVVTGFGFEGARDVGGADADLLCDGLLLDVKAVADPRHRIQRADLLQLLGYALLDYGDDYGIERVGFYFSRTGDLVHWEIPELLDLMGCKESLAALRAGMRKRLDEQRASARTGLERRWAAAGFQARLPGRQDHA
ncbi:hypothetical protein [Kitasatospora aureofaciens]|uniref:hypothetical protein n=1 Tax=Kitasatospora aureofaciens TaxID=1894 RepID=UPI00380A7C72